MYHNLEDETASIIGNFLEKGVILPKEEEAFLSFTQLDQEIQARKPWSISLLAKNPKGYSTEEVLTLPFRTPPTFHSKTEQLAGELDRWLKNNRTVVLAVSTLDKARRLKEVLRDQGIASTIVDRAAEPDVMPRTIRIEIADLESGFEWPGSKLTLLTEVEIYGRQKKRYPSRFRNDGTKINSFTDLKVGDYVVHLNHGIGRFMGLETLEIAGGHRDYLKIDYAGEDR
jgi:transcription-repair coupling factor (superfamily II helicase)